MKTENKTTIEPQKWYTLSAVVKGKMIPWADSFWSARKLVASDSVKRNILKANITGTGRGTKYHLKGENIIKFINEFESKGIKL